jgi:type III restriction enzyme
MKLPLKEFQEDAVIRLVRHLRGAARESRSGDRQAVSLSATTGSGKTVMLTRAIEVLLEGDDEQAPMADAVFLWITDQPELNEQTRKKMLATSSVLLSESLIVVDASFDQETFRPGAVYFLNIQKLGKDKGLVTQGDNRTYSIWEIIRNTIEARPGRFFVVVDEAHRGMVEDKGLAEAATIIQKFIKGSPNEIPPVPVVVGISATPERFTRLIGGTGRINRPVDVDVADVRASGLIKDTIVLHHPSREQPTDMTMLREAARALKFFADHWSTYCAAQEEYTVMPLLVVQVEDSGAKGQLSETDIPQAMRMIRDELGTLNNDAFAHAFQEGTTVSVGGEEIRYVAPSEIQDDPDVRVVFFKTSLNTGWDCPRAEVMMSFRAAADATNIAQLVGRMVRTPLARRIVDDEVLNTVSLYLPHYDSKALDKIITRLSKPDDGSMAPVDVERAEDIVELTRAKGSEESFKLLATLPSYVVPRKRKASQVRRLMKLARLLTNDEVDDDAVSAAKDHLITVVNAEYKRLKGSKRFREIVEERSQIEIEAVNWDVGAESARNGYSVRVDIAAENVEDLFEATGRKLNEGLHKVWWRERVKNAPAERERAKLELFALCVEPDVTPKIERAAQDLVQKWLRTHQTDIAKLEEGKRAEYDEVRNLAASPELSPLVYPATIQARDADGSWQRHLYVDSKGSFTAALNDAEADVLREELNSESVVAWLRNVDRKPWAMTVPYELDGEYRPMYPDFIIVRRERGSLVVDIVDPHSIALADAPAKAAGLAQYAARHSDRFGRIELVMVDDRRTKRIDLGDEAMRNRVRAIKLPEQLRALFQEPS